MNFSNGEYYSPMNNIFSLNPNARKYNKINKIKQYKLQKCCSNTNSNNKILASNNNKAFSLTLNYTISLEPF